MKKIIAIVSSSASVPTANSYVNGGSSHAITFLYEDGTAETKFYSAYGSFINSEEHK